MISNRDVVLETLSAHPDRPMTVTALNKVLERKTGRKMNANTVTLALHRLSELEPPMVLMVDEDDYKRYSIEPRRKGGRPEVFYLLTEEGKRQIDKTRELVGKIFPAARENEGSTDDRGIALQQMAIAERAIKEAQIALQGKGCQ